MPDKKKTVFFWSSGKDSAFALFRLLRNPEVEITHLTTTINAPLQRVTMHGTAVSLVEKQLQSINIPYSFIDLPANPSMEEYEHIVSTKMSALKKNGITHAAFGDIFLEDLKAYREKAMRTLGIECTFPIWKHDTTQLIHEFIGQGFKAVTVCVNHRLGPDFLGREIDHSFLRDLPSDIDPCGENGELHTFCYDGPMFNSSIKFELGQKVKKSYPNPSGNGEVDFWFIELIADS